MNRLGCVPTRNTARAFLLGSAQQGLHPLPRWKVFLLETPQPPESVPSRNIRLDNSGPERGFLVFGGTERRSP